MKTHLTWCMAPVLQKRQFIVLKTGLSAKMLPSDSVKAVVLNFYLQLFSLWNRCMTQIKQTPNPVVLLVLQC